jgi:hypothetical protein
VLFFVLPFNFNFTGLCVLLLIYVLICMFFFHRFRHCWLSVWALPFEVRAASLLSFSLFDFCCSNLLWLLHVFRCLS